MPTDVVPFYQAPTSDLAALTRAQFTLTSATAETIVARAVETQLFTADLTLEKELEPTTTYTLVAVIDAAASPTGATETLSLSFTTGAARSERAGGSPVLLQHYQLAQPPRSLCGPAVAGTCVAVPPGVVVESRLVARGSDAGNGVIELHRDSWFTSFSGIAPGTDFDCLKLRTRAANATYSLPYYVCRSDTGVVPISGSENIA